MYSLVDNSVDNFCGGYRGVVDKVVDKFLVGLGELIQHVFARFTQLKRVRKHVFFLCKNAYKLYTFQTLF